MLVHGRTAIAARFASDIAHIASLKIERRENLTTSATDLRRLLADVETDEKAHYVFD